ncbi:MAG: MBL fold metallo-hydrolase [Halobacteriaceae archaeon]
MRVTLLGTGDTTGTPTPGCDCATCDTARERGVERSRFSVLVENEATGETLLVDASPDFREQFLPADVPLPDAALVTHAHFDHLDGLGNLYRVVDHVDVHAAAAAESDHTVAAAVGDRFPYLDCVTVVPQTPHESFSACGFEVTLVPVHHPPLPTYGVVVTDGDATLALTGDTSFAVPEASKRALSGADLLLADGIVPADFADGHGKPASDYADGTPYTFAGKHMTREGALALADELDADRTRLVHVSHFYPASEAFADPLAVDGERYTI